MTILTVDLGEKRLEFKTNGDLLRWVHSEVSFWEAVQQQTVKQLNSLAKPRLAQQMEAVTALLKVAVAAENKLDGNATEINTIINMMQEMRTDRPNRLLCSAIESDFFIGQIANFDPAAAAAGVLIRSGLNGIQELQPHHLNNIDAIRDAMRRFQLHSHELQAAKLRKDIAALVQNIEQTYQLRQSTDGLIQHWQDSSTSLKKTAMSHLWVFGFVAGVIVVIVGALLVLTPTLGKGADVLAHAPYLVLAAVPLVWTLKHLSRLFLDAQADHRDAMLRHTMARSYVAMMENKDTKPGEKERAIILSALFRPGATQPPEDGVPMPLVELLKRN